MVFASICEHAERCDFFASTSRNKKFKRVLACSCSPNFCVARKLAKQILRANRAKVKFCEQLKILMDHSSPLESVGETAWRPYARTGAMRHGNEDDAVDIVTNMKYI